MAAGQRGGQILDGEEVLVAVVNAEIALLPSSEHAVAAGAEKQLPHRPLVLLVLVDHACFRHREHPHLRNTWAHLFSTFPYCMSFRTAFLSLQVTAQA